MNLDGLIGRMGTVYDDEPFCPIVGWFQRGEKVFLVFDAGDHAFTGVAMQPGADIDLQLMPPKAEQ